ncbi:progestin and adipoQ receptor family member 3 [Anabrus simplex]|uniref:progestin and adipoQ receptor family member 3 n=1 Tax=Anabrus simplex TaxID=316456 RepID=UPI0035A3C256
MAHHTTTCSKKRGRNENREEDHYYEDDKIWASVPLLRWEDAPEHTKFNPGIRTGYRGHMCTRLCLESVFHWTNETMNVWTHVFGFMLGFGLMVHDLCQMNQHVPVLDQTMLVGVLVSAQVSMFLSCVYHTLMCRSDEDHQFFLRLDLLGVSLLLLSLYMSAIYYGFWCDQEWLLFYVVSVLLFCAVVLIVQLPQLHFSHPVKTTAFLLWTLYGLVPIWHQTVRYGGWDTNIVRVFLPRMLGLYGISGLAFFFYVSMVPERLFPGRVDYIGSSHQIWHLLVVLAMYHYHNTGVMYIKYRMNHGCASFLRI